MAIGYWLLSKREQIITSILECSLLDNEHDTSTSQSQGIALKLFVVVMHCSLVYKVWELAIFSDLQNFTKKHDIKIIFQLIFI